jgi:hypothetical protein
VGDYLAARRIRTEPPWLEALRRYMLFIAIGNILGSSRSCLDSLTGAKRVWSWIVFIAVLGTAGEYSHRDHLFGLGAGRDR